MFAAVLQRARNALIPSLPDSEILLKAGVNVVALQRTESARLTSLADTYPGVLIISKGDVSKDEDNKASPVLVRDDEH